MTTDSPLLWYLNRGTGLVLLVLLSASVVLGVLSLAGRPAGDGGGRVPRFVTQALHRNLALGSLILLLAHVTSAVVDGYVDIRWWQAVVPVGATYQPLWLGLGTLSLDVMVAVVATSLLRTRLGVRSWRAVHLTSWLAYALAVVHGIGIGTDLRDRSHWQAWSTWPTAASVVAVLLALGWRWTSVTANREDAARPAQGPARPAGGTR